MPGTALPATTGLWCVPGFLGLAGVAVAVGERKIATPLIYGGTLAVALVALGAALTCFLDSGPPWALVLPIGLPGIGAHFRVDALSAPERRRRLAQPTDHVNPGEQKGFNSLAYLHGTRPDPAEVDRLVQRVLLPLLFG